MGHILDKSRKGTLYIPIDNYRYLIVTIDTI
nr:MAG TPA: hypothetical protein [Bacteriophage sp.]DAM96067.1 MAG TPA: hypothetical protein [Bacteriophage sp.]